MPASGSTEPGPTCPGGPTVPVDDGGSRDGVTAPGAAAPAAHAAPAERAHDREAAETVPEGWFPA
jgi:hypothetical protein